MRQQGDIIFPDIINALREGTLTSNHIDNLKPFGPFAIHNALRIYPTKKQVDDHNTSVLQYYKKITHKHFILKPKTI